jgi:hypothetical protein
MHKTVERQNTIPSGWMAFTPEVQNSYRFGTDKVSPFVNPRSGFVASDDESPERFGTLMQIIAATDFVGTNVRLTGMTKVDKADTVAEIFIEVNTSYSTLIESASFREGCANDWTKFVIEVFVPEQAGTICFGGLLRGTGTVWFNSLEFESEKPEVAPERTPVIDYYIEGRENFSSTCYPEPTNLGFDTVSGSLPEFWNFTGRFADAFRTAMDFADDPAQNCLSLVCENPKRYFGAGAIFQTFDATNWLEQSVELSAYIKSENVREKAYLFLRVHTPSKSILENMDENPVIGTTDWKKESVRLTVPKDAYSISVGFILHGEGSISVKQMGFSKVSSAESLPPQRSPSNARPLKPLNLSLADE